MTRTLKQLAQEALNVQDACNLSGVAQGFARAMLDLCKHVPGTDARNQHPIAVLWADKIAHLTGTQAFGSEGSRITDDAYHEVHRLAEGETHEHDNRLPLGDCEQCQNGADR